MNEKEKRLVIMDQIARVTSNVMMEEVDRECFSVTEMQYILAILIRHLAEETERPIEFMDGIKTFVDLTFSKETPTDNYAESAN